MLLAGQAAFAQSAYRSPTRPADPAAQLAEMIALYDTLCLSAFPDDEAVARDIGEVHVAGGGEAHRNADGSSESLLIAITSPQERFRAAGNTAVEVRFAHQIYQPATQAPVPKT